MVGRCPPNGRARALLVRLFDLCPNCCRSVRPRLTKAGSAHLLLPYMRKPALKSPAALRAV